VALKNESDPLKGNIGNLCGGGTVRGTLAEATALLASAGWLLGGGLKLSSHGPGYQNPLASK